MTAFEDELSLIKQELGLGDPSQEPAIAPVQADALAGDEYDQTLYAMKVDLGLESPYEGVESGPEGGGFVESPRTGEYVNPELPQHKNDITDYVMSRGDFEGAGAAESGMTAYDVEQQFNLPGGSVAFGDEQVGADTRFMDIGTEGSDIAATKQFDVSGQNKLEIQSAYNESKSTNLPPEMRRQNMDFLRRQLFSDDIPTDQKEMAAYAVRDLLSSWAPGDEHGAAVAAQAAEDLEAFDAENNKLKIAKADQALGSLGYSNPTAVQAKNILIPIANAGGRMAVAFLESRAWLEEATGLSERKHSDAAHSSNLISKKLEDLNIAADLTDEKMDVVNKYMSRGARMGLSSAAEFAPIAAAGPAGAVHGLAAIMAYSGGVSAATSYGEARRSGLDHTDATYHAMVKGGTEVAGTGLIGPLVGRVLGDKAAGNLAELGLFRDVANGTVRNEFNGGLKSGLKYLAKKIGVGTAAEIPEELVIELGQLTTDYYNGIATGKKGDLPNADAMIKTSVDTILATMFATGGMSSPQIARATLTITGSQLAARAQRDARLSAQGVSLFTLGNPHAAEKFFVMGKRGETPSRKDMESIGIRGSSAKDRKQFADDVFQVGAHLNEQIRDQVASEEGLQDPELMLRAKYNEQVAQDTTPTPADIAAQMDAEANAQGVETYMEGFQEETEAASEVDAALEATQMAPQRPSGRADAVRHTRATLGKQKASVVAEQAVENGLDPEQASANTRAQNIEYLVGLQEAGFVEDETEVYRELREEQLRGMTKKQVAALLPKGAKRGSRTKNIQTILDAEVQGDPDPDILAAAEARLQDERDAGAERVVTAREDAETAGVEKKQKGLKKSQGRVKMTRAKKGRKKTRDALAASEALAEAEEQKKGRTVKGRLRIMLSDTYDEETSDALAEVWDSFTNRIAKSLGITQDEAFDRLLEDVKHGVDISKKKGGLRQAEAWHGSPHNIMANLNPEERRFLTKNMGTGEGAQAFGWGLYFTNKEGVARAYADRLGSPQAGDGVPTLDGIVSAMHRWQKHQGSKLGFFRFLKKAVAAAKDRGVDGDKTSASQFEAIWKAAEEKINEAIEVHQVTMRLREENPGKSYIKTPDPERPGQVKVKLLSDKTKFIDELEQYRSDMREWRSGLFQARNRNLYKTTLWKGKDQNLLEWIERTQDDLIEAAKRDFGTGFMDIVNRGMSIPDRISRVIPGSKFYHSLHQYFGDNPPKGSNGDPQRDASLWLLEQGVHGIKFPAQSGGRGDGSKGWNYVVFDDADIVIDQHIQYQGDRGRVVFDGMKALVELGKDADPSTFLHESAHIFHNYLLYAEANGSLSDQDAKDLAAIDDYVSDEDTDTDKKEKLARAFENYHREGKAPTTALGKAFEGLKKWLKGIYKKNSDLKADLTPEIRAVFDSWYSSPTVAKKKAAPALATPSKKRPVPKTEYGENLGTALDDYLEHLRKDKGFTEEQLDEIRDVVIDEMTGLINGKSKVRTTALKRGQAAADRGEDAAYYYGDVVNVGGLNEKAGGMENANKVMKKAFDLVVEAAKAESYLSDDTRRGGDEADGVAHGASSGRITRLRAWVNDQLYKYIIEEFSDDIARDILFSPVKDNAKAAMGGIGVGLILESFDFNKHVDYKIMMEYSDLRLEKGKKSQENIDEQRRAIEAAWAKYGKGEPGTAKEAGSKAGQKVQGRSQEGRAEEPGGPVRVDESQDFLGFGEEAKPKKGLTKKSSEKAESVAKAAKADASSIPPESELRGFTESQLKEIAKAAKINVSGLSKPEIIWRLTNHVLFKDPEMFTPLGPTLSEEETENLDGPYDIIKFIGQTWGSPTFFGKVFSGLKAKAQYWVAGKAFAFTNEVAGSIAVGAHEMAHRIEADGDLNGWTAEAKAELDRMDYSPSREDAALKTREGFAEFLRVYYTGDRAALAKALPNATKEWEATLKKDKVLSERVGAVEEKMNRLRRAHGAAQVEATIEFDPAAAEDVAIQKAEEMWESFESMMYDSERALEKFSAAALGKPVGGTVAEKAAYVARTGRLDWSMARKDTGKLTGWELSSVLRNTEGALAYDAVRHEVRSLATGEVLGEGLEDALSPVAEERMVDWMKYAVAVHTKERRSRGIQEGALPDKSYQETIDKYKDEPGFQEGLERFTKFHRSLLKMMVQAGAMGQKDMESSEAMFEYYIPMLKMVEADMRGRFETAKYRRKKARGSSNPVRNPLHSTMVMVNGMYAQAIQAMISKRIESELQGSTADLSQHMRPIDPKNIDEVLVRYPEIKKALEDAGYEVTDIADEASIETMAKVMGIVRPGKDDKPVISVLQEDGSRNWYELTPELYQAAVVGPPKSHDNVVLKAARTLTSLKKAGTTTWRPNFVFWSNLIRDIQSALINTENNAVLFGFKYIEYVVRVFIHNAKKATGRRGDAVIEMWERHGGNLSTYFGEDSHIVKDNMKKMMQRMRRGKKGAKGLRGVINAGMKRYTENPLMTPFRMFGDSIDIMRIVFNAPESFTRLAEMDMTLRKHGVKPKDIRTGNIPSQEVVFRAMLDAHEVSLNFKRAGTVSREWNRYKAFFNAMHQGYNQPWRKFKSHPLRTIMRGITTQTIPTLIYWSLVKDEDWYKELKPWERATFWYLPNPFGEGRIAIPRAFDVSYVFSSLAEAMLNEMEGRDPEAAQEMYEHIISSYTLSFTSIVPDAMVGPLENGLGLGGYDFFWNSPISPRGTEKAYAKYQTSDRDPKVLQDLSTWAHDTMGVEVSPAHISNYISETIGGLWVDLLHLPEHGPTKALGTNRIVKPLSRGVSVGRMYDNKDKIWKVVNGKVREKETVSVDEYQKLVRYTTGTKWLGELNRNISSLPNAERQDAQRYLTGLARFIDGKSELDKYPNPMGKDDAPEEVRAVMEDMMISMIRTARTKIRKAKNDNDMNSRVAAIQNASEILEEF